MAKYFALWLIVFSASFAALALLAVIVKNQINADTSNSLLATLIGKL